MRDMAVGIKADAELPRREARRLKRSLARMMRNLLPGRDLEVSLVLADERETRRLNSMYRGRDETTDVLAFPQMGPAELRTSPSRKPPAHEPLGDIVICVPVAERQAAERAATRFDELEILAAHGLLHLAGYEDETEDGAAEMEVAERRLLGRSIIR